MRDDVSARIDAVGLRSGGERIELGYGPHAAYTLPPEALASIGEHARERGALVHIHVAEARRGGPRAARRARVGARAARRASALLDGRVLAAHGVQLSDADVALLAAAGRGGRALPRVEREARRRDRAGDRAAAGGGPGGAGHRRARRPATTSTCGPRPGSPACSPAWARGDAAALTAAELLLMATRDGAAAIGRDDLGVLEAGRWADLVHVDLDDPAFADPDDDAQLLSNLVWAGGSRLVTDVWVAGEQSWPGASRRGSTGAATTAGLRAVAARLRP